MNKKALSLVVPGILVFLGFPLSHVSAQLHAYGTLSDFHPLILNAEMAAASIFGAVAVICFLISGVSFLTAEGQPEKLKLARSSAIWGVAGVAVGIIAFSIIAIVGKIIS